MNSDSKVNEIYIRFVTLHSLWSGNSVLYSSSVENVLTFVIRVLLCVMIATVSSIYLIVSKILWCVLGELIDFLSFSGQISRVYFIVKQLLSIFTVIACLMRRLQMVFLPFPSRPSCSLLLLLLSFSPF